jgi:hypothetical protein
MNERARRAGQSIYELARSLRDEVDKPTPDPDEAEAILRALASNVDALLTDVQRWSRPRRPGEAEAILRALANNVDARSTDVRRWSRPRREGRRSE